MRAEGAKAALDVEVRKLAPQKPPFPEFAYIRNGICHTRALIALFSRGQRFRHDLTCAQPARDQL
jgi:hypothetical protein